MLTRILTLCATVALGCQVFLLFGCALFKTHPEQHADSPSEELANAQAMWLGMLAEATDATGWPSTHDCDGTLWAGLARAAGAIVDLELAEYSPGEIHRRPAPCWTPQDGDIGSGSTVSRDMLVGYLWGWWQPEGLEPIRRLVTYGEAHDWVMGLPVDRVEVHMGRNLTGLACRALKALSRDQDARLCAREGAAYGPVIDDYERHLQALSILLQGEVDQALRGGVVPGPNGMEGVRFLAIDGLMFEVLKFNVTHWPDDALFQAAYGVYTGDYEKATALLLDESYVCPSYVRGADSEYCLVHKAFAAMVILKHQGG